MLEMEEEMEGRMVVEFVVRTKEKWWRNGWPKEREGGSFGLLLASLLAAKRRKEMKEGEGGSGYIMEGDII